MTALVHFSKHDATLRVESNNETYTELAEYTVSWSDLTGAGFADGDDVLLIVQCKVNGDDTANQLGVQVGQGSTFAGRTILSKIAESRADAASTTVAFQPFFWIDRVTLATNDNIYTAWAIPGAGAGVDDIHFEDFSIQILKLGDLTENVDFKYAEAAPAGNAPSTMTTGASVTIPAGSENWLVLGCAHFLIDGTANNASAQLSIAGTARMMASRRGKNAAEAIYIGQIFYAAAPANGATIAQQYQSDGSAIHDCDESKVFILRLGAFAQATGQYDGTDRNLTPVDTFVQGATTAVTPDPTGDFLLLGMATMNVSGEATKNLYGRIQVDNVDFVSGFGRASNGSYAVADFVPFYCGGIVSLTSGASRTIDLDLAEDSDVSPAGIVTDSVIVAISMELAASGAASAVGAQALRKLAQAGVGVLTFIATGSSSLRRLSQSGTAISREDVTISGDQALPSVDQAGSATEQFIVTGAQGLPSVDQAGDASERFIGVGAQPLARAAQSGIAVMHPRATGASGLPGVDQSGSALEIIIAAAASALAHVTQAGNGIEHPRAAGASALARLLQAGTAAEWFIGSGASQLPAPFVLAGAGLTGAAFAAAAQQLAKLAQAGVLIMHPRATGASVLARLLLAGGGEERFIGAGAQALAHLVQSGVVIMQPRGVGEAVLASIDQAGAGSAGAAFATGAQTLARARQSGIVVMHPNVVGASVLAHVIQIGSGLEIVLVTGASVLPRARQSSSAAVILLGSGAPVLPGLDQSGTGLEALPGAAAHVLRALQQAGLGELRLAGTAAQILARIIQSGDGVLPFLATEPLRTILAAGRNPVVSAASRPVFIPAGVRVADVAASRRPAANPGAGRVSNIVANKD